MADKDDQDETETQGGSAEGSQSGSSSGKGSGDGGSDSGADVTKVDPKDEEIIRTRDRMRAADKRASELEKELKAIRDKDLPEAEKTRKELEEVSKANEQLSATNAKLRIENAFLTDNTYKWRDPKLAMKNVDQSAIDIDSDGNVTGLKEALKKLATDYPFMLEDTKPDGDGDSEGDGAGTGRVDRTPTMNGGKRGTDKASRETIASRFPASRSRW